ncbi:FAD-dependent oxidoreductase [Glaciihabitans arcticus]|uniref:FAD-dependent oxidoreductase n=1 Tax=Glaciihabitans arcticus TaxID=2668039 RepID=A0A4Q9GNT8_9MICO|nr:FAD-dependent oxidoreductase [Glaciihabitans arcticus]TBN56391.1 FAD-dependent oxidoreductase [Glaciihabitans arcticus]
MTSLWLAEAPPIPTDDFLPGAHYDEVIVGAGLTGLVSALLLARSGRRVAVLEARTVGAVSTGNTTAKLSLLQGTQLSKIRSTLYQSATQAYVDGATAGFDWLLRYCELRGVPVERRDAYTYAATPDGAAQVEREYEVARSTGLPVQRVNDVELPFPTFGAVLLPDQAQFDPLRVLAALAEDVRALGGVIHEGARVTRVAASSPTRVVTSLGDLAAERVILATGTPILDRGLYFAKLSAHRSYALSARVPEEQLPDGMFLGAETPTRSIRTHGDLLLTGGNGHAVGRHPSPQRAADELLDWTLRYWPGADVTHTWSAQDYSTPHHVAFVGFLPRGRGRIYLATGYEKWGMTGAVTSALTLHADLLGGRTDWQRTLHRRFTTPEAIGRGIGENAAVGWWYLKGYAHALSTPLPQTSPAEGEGVVGRRGVRPVGLSTVDATTCAVSAVCPHLGAALTWNDAERSWDCPAHGSRFSASGTRLEGPATRDLTPVN